MTSSTFAELQRSVESVQLTSCWPNVIAPDSTDQLKWDGMDGKREVFDGT
jgi:hypothetical protein